MNWKKSDRHFPSARLWLPLLPTTSWHKTPWKYKHSKVRHPSVQPSSLSLRIRNSHITVRRNKSWPHTDASFPLAEASQLQFKSESSRSNIFRCAKAAWSLLISFHLPKSSCSPAQIHCWPRSHVSGL